MRFVLILVLARPIATLHQLRHIWIQSPHTPTTHSIQFHNTKTQVPFPKNTTHRHQPHSQRQHPYRCRCRILCTSLALSDTCLPWSFLFFFFFFFPVRCRFAQPPASTRHTAFAPTGTLHHHGSNTLATAYLDTIPAPQSDNIENQTRMRENIKPFNPPQKKHRPFHSQRKQPAAARPTRNNILSATAAEYFVHPPPSRTPPQLAPVRPRASFFFSCDSLLPPRSLPLCAAPRIHPPHRFRTHGHAPSPQFKNCQKL